MPKRKRRLPEPQLTHEAACEVLREALRGGTRAGIVDQVLRSPTFGEALRRLRAGMRSHVFPTASGPLDLAALVEDLDERCRAEGFHLMQAWDPSSHRFTSETNPVLLLDFVVRYGVVPGSERTALAILLDSYFLYLLSLPAMRVWDEEDPDAALDRVTDLVDDLQGTDGSGHRFVDDAETLLLLSISQYQPDEDAYDRLLERLRTLDEAHQLRVALPGAANFGCHLRWGFQFMYRREPARMRKDNVVDYPWLLYLVATLMRAYEHMREVGTEGEARERVVEGLLNGFTADPTAFTGAVPDFLAPHEAEHAYFREGLRRHRAALLHEAEAHRPTERAFSPLSFHFNFMHNALAAKVAVALLRGTAPNLPFNALFTREPAGVSLSRSPEILARMMTEFSASDPTRHVHRGAGLIGYDPAMGKRSFEEALDALRALDGAEAEPVAGGG